MSKIFLTKELPGRTVRTDDAKEYLWFSGTDYLGMGHAPDYMRYLGSGLQQFGTHFGSSRNNTLQLEIYKEAENLFAAFAGAPGSLLTSSGMWAAQLVVKYCTDLIAKTTASTHYAPNTHPALWNSQFTGDNSLQWPQWAQATVRKIREDKNNQEHFIFTDSIRSPLPQHYDFTIFSDLPDNQKITLVIDDSHGLGVVGKAGNGSYAFLPKFSPNISVIVVASLNKAMGIPAGIVLAELSVLDRIKKTPWFSGSSPTSPAYIAAAVDLLKNGCYPHAHSKLISNIAYLKSSLTKTNDLAFIENYPVFCSAETPLHDHLLKRTILTTCFSYPTPEDKPLVRIVINASHQKEDLDALAEAINEFF